MTNEGPHSFEEEHEKKHSWQFMKWIFKVLFSPMKTFEEIVKKPNIKGPILILLIMLPITLGGQYISGTKFFLEIPTPENDLWTEKQTNQPSFLWEPDDTIAFDNNDFIIGNYSVSASLINSSLIWMRLTNIEYSSYFKENDSRLFFSIKWVNEENVPPTNATLQLFLFSNVSERFELDIKSDVANSSNVWANVSANFNSENWTHNNSTIQANITGIGFQLRWADSANLTLKIDDLFFGTYTSLSSSNTFAPQLAYLLMQNSIQFLLEWIILSGVVFLLLKSLSDWTGPWKNLLSTVGYSYSPSIIYSGVLVLLFLFLPPVFFPYNISYSESLNIYQLSWGIPISVVGLVYYGWLTILCGISLKKLHELSWSKAFLISFGAIVMSLLLSAFILSAFF